ncbi:SPASM domain-containing protein, partial [Candidatus Woesearchaeota archaeon]|nr:SPASM domain-containing protein [Candidatus Woesearchaeota archaeon]
LTTMDEMLLGKFIESPPFNIETTLNAATPETYRRITGTGLFGRQVEAIKKLTENKVKVRVKTQVTKENVHEIDEIKELVEGMGKDFRPSTLLNARLNHDTDPCMLRLDPKEAVEVNRGYGFYDEETQQPGEKLDLRDLVGRPESDKLFTCAVGEHSFIISPKGEMFLCTYLREPDYDLSHEKATVKEGFMLLSREVQGRAFRTHSKCRTCKYRLLCKWCPARAMLEKDSLEEPIGYYCELTRELVRSLS